MTAFWIVLQVALSLLQWAVIIVAVMSWLIAFNIINNRNQAVQSIWNSLCALTAPFLRPIRSVVPNFNGVDISPVILLLIVLFFKELIAEYTGVR